MEPAIHPRMKQLVAHLTGWLAALLFIVAATVLWGSASLVVFLSGNTTLHSRS